jgi:Carboxypeptidase regulatory-like domain
MTNKVKLASLALVVVIAGSVGLAYTSQSASSAGSISGTVTDPSGAVVPGATVTISSAHFAETVSTDDIGRYATSSLVPEHYTVRIHANGFSTFEKTGLVVSPGHVTEADGPLSIGKVYQAITVTDRDTESPRAAD